MNPFISGLPVVIIRENKPDVIYLCIAGTLRDMNMHVRFACPFGIY